MNPLGLAPIGAGGVFPAGTAGQQPQGSSSPLTSLGRAATTVSAAKTVGGLAADAAPLLLHSGGVVPGNPADGDVHPALLTGGERVLPAPPAHGDLLNVRQHHRRWGTTNTFSPQERPKGRLK